MKMRMPLTLGLLALAAVLIVALALVRRPAPPPPGPEPHAEAGHQDAESRPSTTVTLTQEQVRAAGVRVVPVAPRAFQETLALTGVVHPHPDRTAKVVAPVAGRLVDLRAGEGDAVRSGALLAVVDSPQVADRRAAVRSAAERLAVARRSLERQRTLAREALESTGPILEARLRRDRARSERDRAERAWERARRLHPDLVSRRDYEAARSELLNARAELDTAEQLYAAERRMAARSTRQRATIAEAEAEVDAAAAELSAARESLAALSAGEGSAGEIPVTAPLSGTVTARPAGRGQWVEAGETLFTVVDLSRVWAVLDVYEKDMARVRVGQAVEVRSPAVPDRVFRGRVAHLDPILQEGARTAHARVALDNPGDHLRAEMFVNARLLLGGSGRGLAVPLDAVVVDGDRTHVYVEEAPGRFTIRAVELGPAEDGWRAVRSGLRAGERVVVAGAFALKSEQHRGEMGEEDGH